MMNDQRACKLALFSALSRAWGSFQSSPDARHSLGLDRKLEQSEKRTGIFQAAHPHR
ncbi:MAG: hypothetical protein AAB359_03610 [Elusimicrobiota bacterium]